MALPPMDELRNVTLDVSTLTLGEAAEAERQSGMTIGELARGRASLKLLALFVHGLRNYAPAPSWSELSNLRLLDASSSTTQPTPDGASQTSNG